MSGAAEIARHLRPGCRVAVADGSGAPIGLAADLTAAATEVGGVNLLLGWCFAPPADLDDAEAFPEIRTIMGGYALRRPIAAGRVHYVPARISAVPGLLAGPLRPDVLVAALRPGRRGGYAFGSEVAWMRAAVDAGATVLAEVNPALPAADAEEELPADRVIVVAEADRPPHRTEPAAIDDDARAIGERVAALIREGACIQVGPGKIAEAAVAALDVPVAVDSGVIVDTVVDLAERGLLLGDPVATYLVGTDRLYEWADGRPLLRRVEHTHDPSRLTGRSLVAINTALQIDAYGSVNVERVGGQTIGGVGGHGDYAAAAARAAAGLSIIALPTTRGGEPTLVEQLDAPASTGYADVDVVVTERGVADLRGLDAQERRRAIAALWGDDPGPAP